MSDKPQNPTRQEMLEKLFDPNTKITGVEKYPGGKITLRPEVAETIAKYIGDEAAPLEGDLLESEHVIQPLLNVASVKAMAEFKETSFEDRITQRLMLAMARGEIRLELDGTPEGKLRDAQVVKEYLTQNAGYFPHETRDQWLEANGGVSMNPNGSLAFEYPGDEVADINPPRPTEEHANQILEKVPLKLDSRNVDFADIAPSLPELLGIDPDTAKKDQ